MIPREERAKWQRDCYPSERMYLLCAALDEAEADNAVLRATVAELVVALEDAVNEMRALLRAGDSDYARPDEACVKELVDILARAKEVL